MNINIVVNNTAYKSVRQAFNISENELLNFRDDLTWGSVPAINDLPDWLQQRDAFWNAEGYEPFSFRELPNDFYAATEQLKQADNIVLWLDKSLKTQITACCVLAFCRLLNICWQRISLRCYYVSGDEYPYPGYIPLPADTAPQEQNCVPVTLTEAEWHYRLQCWDAYTSSTPEKLLQIIHSDNAACPVLHNALTTLKNRFPAYDSGLTIWDKWLLQGALEYDPNVKAAKVLGYASYPARNGVDRALDTYLYDRLLALGNSRLAAPLLKLNVEDMPVKFCVVNITESGRAALRGEFNTVLEHGFDDWIGGIALNSATGGLWFRHDDGSVRYHKLPY